MVADGDAALGHDFGMTADMDVSAQPQGFRAPDLAGLLDTQVGAGFGHVVQVFQGMLRSPGPLPRELGRPRCLRVSPLLLVLRQQSVSGFASPEWLQAVLDPRGDTDLAFIRAHSIVISAGRAPGFAGRVSPSWMDP